MYWGLTNKVLLRFEILKVPALEILSRNLISDIF